MKLLEPRIVLANDWLALSAVRVETQILGVSRSLLEHKVCIDVLCRGLFLLLLSQPGDDVPLADHLGKVHTLEAGLAVGHLAHGVMTEPYLLCEAKDLAL